MNFCEFLKVMPKPLDRYLQISYTVDNRYTKISEVTRVKEKDNEGIGNQGLGFKHKQAHVL